MYVLILGNVLPILLGITGILTESFADYQKSKYRSNIDNNSHWCDVGLYKVVRYPNYAGEILTWWSFYSLAAPSLPWYQAILSLISPVFITFLITNVSGIPLLEKINDKKYVNNIDYQLYKKTTPLLIPSISSLTNGFNGKYSKLSKDL